MEFLCPPTKVWEDDVSEFFIQTASDGTIWVHYNIKTKITRTVLNQVYLGLCEFFEVIKATFSVNKVHAWCPTPRVRKWALYNGFYDAGIIMLDGKEFHIVEFA